MPTALLPEEILLGGDGQIKALICLGGNPMLSWPDQARTERALKSLDLLVVLDTQMTETARLAEFVVAAPMSLETAGSTSRVEALKYVGVARGFSIPWAQYTERVVAPPAGSDLVEDASFFFRLAQRMGLALSWTNTPGYRSHVEGPSHTVRLDMTREPTNEELIELTCASSRVPLAEVKRFPHGRVFEEVSMKVAARAPDCTARLQLADALMMEELGQVLRESPRAASLGPRTHLLTSRRINKVMNSVGHEAARGTEGEGETPAFLNPVDFPPLGLTPGDVATVTSDHGAVRVRLYADDGLRPGVVSVVHGFSDTRGGSPAEAVDRRRSVTRLISMEEMDQITGIPRLSALPVSIAPARAAD
jgi:anaerobic selenocysteine-containing dehydrogenase